MTDTAALLEEVVAVLHDALPDVAVELYPEKPDTYRLSHPVGAVLVAYRGATFGPQLPQYGYAQERLPGWRTVVLFRQQYGRAGALAYLDQVRARLLRFRPTGARYVCRALAETFLDEETGIWRYATDWQVSLPADEDAATVDESTLGVFVTYHHDLDLVPIDGIIEASDTVTLPQ